MLISQLTKIITTFDVCDIYTYRLRNPDTRRFTYRQNSPKRLHRLDYFILSNSIQEIVEKNEVLTSVSSNNSPVLVIFNSFPQNRKGSAYWKFNSLQPSFFRTNVQNWNYENSLENSPSGEMGTNKIQNQRLLY